MNTLANPKQVTEELGPIVPYRVLGSPRVFRNPSAWILLLFGLGPLVEFSRSPGVRELVVFLVIYFAAAWCAYLYTFVFKRSVSLKTGLAVAAFSCFIGYPLDLLLSRFPPLSWLYSMTTAKTASERVLAYIAGVGLEEECIKAIPIIVTAVWLTRIKRPQDGLFFGALSGLGFAVNESVKFIVGMHNPAGILGQTLLRTTALPLLHALWTAVSGYFIFMAMRRTRRPRLLLGGIAIASVVHGSFDVAPDGWPTICAGLLVYLLFLGFVAQAEELAAQDDTAAQFTTSPPSVSCAKPNEIAVGG